MGLVNSVSCECGTDRTYVQVVKFVFHTLPKSNVKLRSAFECIHPEEYVTHYQRSIIVQQKPATYISSRRI